jgi:hypothetical protein
MVATATRVLSARVHQCVEDGAERRRNQRWAEQAWQAEARRCGGGRHSEDYARGFKDGFAEYLYRGWVEPPPLPPEHYRSLRYQMPQGYRAIQDWFSGYRHGVALAQQGGQREWITGPSSLRGPPPEAPCPAPAVAAPPPAGGEKSGGWRIDVRCDWGGWKGW